MEKLLELLESFSGEPIDEGKEYIWFNDREEIKKYTIRRYKRNEPDGMSYISKHRHEIKAFMDAGYRAAGLGDFLGCSSASSVKGNTSLLKVAVNFTGDIIAMSIYSSYPQGTKCVGITKIVTTNPELDMLAKEAVQTIIKEDISNFQDFVWCECSDAVEHYWEKFSNGWLKVPASYLSVIFPPQTLSKIIYIDRDDYHYIRPVRNNDGQEIRLVKCVYGFPNKTILDDYLKMCNMNLDEFIEKLKQNNSLDEQIFNNVPNDIKNAHKIVKFICNVHEDERTFELTEYEHEVIIKNIDLINDFIANRSGRLSEHNREELLSIIELGTEMVNMCSILRPYTLLEELIPEQEIYKDDTKMYY